MKLYLAALALVAISCNGPGATTADAGDDAETSLSDSGTVDPPALGPCSEADDCMITNVCNCAEPILASDEPSSCWYEVVSDNGQFGCTDSYGRIGTGGTALCSVASKECVLFGGDVCDVVTSSPHAGVESLLIGKECSEDADCTTGTRFNPCGCEEVFATNSSETSHVAAWNEEVMADVWESAASACGAMPTCDCPDVTGSASCVGGWCEFSDN